MKKDLKTQPCVFLQTFQRTGREPIIHYTSSSLSFTGMLPVKGRLNYFIELKEIMQDGKIKTVLDNHYPLAQIAEAHKYLEKVHKKGNMVITV